MRGFRWLSGPLAGVFLGWWLGSVASSQRTVDLGQSVGIVGLCLCGMFQWWALDCADKRVARLEDEVFGPDEIPEAGMLMYSVSAPSQARKGDPSCN